MNYHIPEVFYTDSDMHHFFSVELFEIDTVHND